LILKINNWNFRRK